jgi:hypothetical protein
MRVDLERVVNGLLADPKNEISLDELGAAIGGLAASTDEIDAVISALESKGRTVGTRTGKTGVAMLRTTRRSVARSRHTRTSQSGAGSASTRFAKPSRSLA